MFKKVGQINACSLPTILLTYPGIPITVFYYDSHRIECMMVVIMSSYYGWQQATQESGEFYNITVNQNVTEYNNSNFIPKFTMDYYQL